MNDERYRLIRHGTSPTVTTPEPGWSSCCTHPSCPGHWRTGLATEDDARQAYAEHRCGAS